MNKKSYYSILEMDLIFDNRITNTSKVVYAVISNYANNENGYCYLSYSQLSKICNLKIRNFIYCLNSLVKYEYIKKIYKNNRVYLQPTINKVIPMRSHKNKIDNLFDYDWLQNE